MHLLMVKDIQHKDAIKGTSNFGDNCTSLEPSIGGPMDDFNACHQVMRGDLQQVAICQQNMGRGSVTTGIPNSDVPLQVGDSSSVSALRIAYEMAEKARRRMDMDVCMDQPFQGYQDQRTMTSQQATVVNFSVNETLRVNSASQLDTLIRSIYRDDEQHRRQGEEEWEKSFVGSSSDIPCQRPPLQQRQQMDAMIDQFGRSLPSASSLLHMLLENKEKDEIFGDTEQHKDSPTTSSTCIADDMPEYFLMEED
jgi:hypothetical protein